VNGSATRLYTPWDGPLALTAITAPDVLTVTVSQAGGTVTLALALRELEIPFSARKYYDDPDGFFAVVGVERPAGGYRSDIVNFTGRGDVEIAQEAFDQKVLEAGPAIGKCVNLPPEFVSCQRVVVEGTPEAEMVNVGVTVGAAVEGVAGVPAVAIGIVLCKRRRTAEQASEAPFTLVP
jgi:hypothetical protein